VYLDIIINKSLKKKKKKKELGACNPSPGKAEPEGLLRV
jgi:hypothetical protein